MRRGARCSTTCTAIPPPALDAVSRHLRRCRRRFRFAPDRRSPVLRWIATLARAGAPADAPLRSEAQTFSQYPGGSVVPMNGHTLGGAAEINGDMFAFMGQ